MIRSCLFVPGDRPERFDRAAASGAHAIVIDLEDAVQPEAKEMARCNIADWLQNGGTDGAEVIVRINGIGTPWHADDIALLGRSGIRHIMLPKAEDVTELNAFVGALPLPLPVIALIETARGLWNVGDLAAIKGIARLGFGSVDFQLDTGIRDEAEGLLYARSRIVVASAMAGLVAPLDGVCVNLDDMTVLEQDTAHAKELGFGGKMCIHPKQVEVVNRGFAPSSDELVWAGKVVAAADTEGAKGAIRLDGKLIDLPVVERARQLLGGEK
jgi:citrate lyase subunit beta/citryl-CoA lyase